MSAIVAEVPDKGAVLCEALLNVAQQLGMTQLQLGKTIGLNRSSVSRLKQKNSIDPGSKEGELALLLIRLHRALFALNGGDQQLMQHFLNTDNNRTGDVPMEQIQTVEGLVRVLNFLDAIRGKN